MLNLQVGILTPVLTGAAVLLEEEICSTRQEQKPGESCCTAARTNPDGSSVNNSGTRALSENVKMCLMAGD